MNKPVGSNPVSVTFFEDRSEVTRRALVQVGADRAWVRISGPTVYLDDRSIQARVVKGAARVLAARVLRQWRNVPRQQASRLDELRQKLERMQHDEEKLQRDQSRSQTRRGQINGMLNSAIGQLAQVPGFGQDGQGNLEGWQKSLQALLAQDEAEFARELDTRFALEDAHRKSANVRGEIQFASGADSFFEAFVEVQLESSSGDECEVEIVYRTPCALWRPEHMASLQRDARKPDSGGITLTTWGVVWQRTGEDWKNIEVRFSTARPAQISDPPLLDDDLLSRRKKTAEERKKVVVEMREQAVESTGGARQAPQMPGVDDGGVPLEFAPKGHFEIPTNGQPTRVEISSVQMPAAVARVLMPERTAVVHLKAKATWPGPHPLLAGPLRVARGSSLVGRARVGFVGAGESFELGFGADDGLRCKRQVSEEREQAAITGTQTIKRHVTLYLSNLSSDARDAELVERTPVSEIEGLEVKLTEVPGWQPDAKDGYLKRNVNLAANATETLAYRYEIKAGKNVQLPF